MRIRGLRSKLAGIDTRLREVVRINWMSSARKRLHVSGRLTGQFFSHPEIQRCMCGGVGNPCSTSLTSANEKKRRLSIGRLRLRWGMAYDLLFLGACTLPRVPPVCICSNYHSEIESYATCINKPRLFNFQDSRGLSARLPCRGDYESRHLCSSPLLHCGRCRHRRSSGFVLARQWTVQ